jgi:hypothetical protein
MNPRIHSTKKSNQGGEGKGRVPTAKTQVSSTPSAHPAARAAVAAHRLTASRRQDKELEGAEAEEDPESITGVC